MSANKNVRKMPKAVKMKPKTEEEAKEILADDLTEYVHTIVKTIEIGKEHLERPQKFTEAVVTYRMVFGDNIEINEEDKNNIFDALDTLKQCYKDVEDELKKLTLENVLNLEDPLAKHLKIISREDKLVDIFCKQIYNQQLTEFGTMYHDVIYKEENKKLIATINKNK